MICSEKAATPQESKFRKSKTSQDMIYDAALKSLLTSLGSLEAAKELQKAFEGAEDPSAEGLTPALKVACLTALWYTRPSYRVDVHLEAQTQLREHLKVYHGPMGPEWLIRSSGPGKVFTLSPEAYKGLLHAGTERFTVVRDLLARLHFSRELLAFAIYDKHTGGSTELLASDRLAERMVGNWLQGGSKQLKDFRKATNLAPEAIQSLGSALEGLLIIASIMDTTDLEKLLVCAGILDYMVPQPKDSLEPMGESSWLSKLMIDSAGFGEHKIPPTLTNCPDTAAFAYFDLNSLEDMPTPAFDNWLSRIVPECREFFMALLFAPLVAKCRHRKVCWIKSEGFDGKSTFFRALSRFTGGNLVGNVNSDSLSDDFGLAATIGKRILVMADCRNKSFLRLQAVHNITGNDGVLINRKNQPHINYEFNAMVFVGANFTPEVDLHQDNSRTRIAYIPMEKATDEQLKSYALVGADGKVVRQSDGSPIYTGSNFEEELIKEMPGILYKCRGWYERLCPRDGEVMTPPKAYEIMLRDCGSEEGDSMDTYSRAYLEFGAGFSMGKTELHDHYRRVNKLPANTYLLADFQRFVERHGAKLVRNNHTGRRYEGVRLKQD